MRKLFLVILASWFMLVVSCSQAPASSENRALAPENDAFTYTNVMKADELIDAINNMDPEHEIFSKCPEDLSKIGITKLQIEFIDDRRDVDPEGELRGDIVVTKDEFAPPAYKALIAPPERNGWKFLGWEMSAADYSVDAHSGIVKDIRTYLKNYCSDVQCGDEDSDLLDYLKGRGVVGDNDELDWESLNYRTIAAGETFKNYFENVICAYFAAASYNSTVGEHLKDFPTTVKLRALWEYSGDKVRVEYHDWTYDGDHVASPAGPMIIYEDLGFGRKNAVEMPHRWMYSGTDDFGKLTKIKPSKVGYRFAGWTDNGVKGVCISCDDVYGDNSALFNGYSNGSTCVLYPVWEEDSSVFYKPTSSTFVSYTGDTGFKQSFSAVDALVTKINKAKVRDNDEEVSLEQMSEFTIPRPYYIATQDVSGDQYKKLLEMVSAHSDDWQFESFGYEGDDYASDHYSNGKKLEKPDDFEIDLTDDFWRENADIIKNDLDGNQYKRYNKPIAWGVRVDYAKHKITQARYGNQPSYDYPLVRVNLPQAIVICNMFTAAYNQCHPDSLTYAYANFDTDDVTSSFVIKNLDDAVAYIKSHAAGQDHAMPLAREGATGFRLPTPYEYEAASSIIPSSNEVGFLNSHKDDLLNSAFPAFAKSASLFDSIFGTESASGGYIGKNSTDVVTNASYKNPLGMIHATGNVRKWLDSPLEGNGNLISFDEKSTPTETLTLPVKIPGIFKNDAYSQDKNAYDITEWFPGLAGTGVTASLKKYSTDGKELTFEFKINTKHADVGTIRSDLNIPAPLMKSGRVLKIENALCIYVQASDVYYMVRSGSFLQTNANESHIHKYYDYGDSNPRKSSSPYNYAFYDLGMRLARSI